ncbi:MAG: type II toxin-antitoxin system PemK/MazF family toxin [Ignavibacteria bacterium]|nr:MAG: type II toxin-antitoxin system PemK/MazF family toxin [Ignavibacteria bacterium]
MSFPRRGEIYVVNLDPTIGAEIKKTRPGLIIQNDISNRSSPLTIVAAITSKFALPPYPTEVVIEAPEGGLKDDSVVLTNQIRTVDMQRLTRRLGRVTPETLHDVDQALLVSLGLVAL